MNDVGLISYGGFATGNERYMLELITALLGRNDGLRYTVFYTRESARERLGEHADRARFFRVWPETRLLRQTVALSDLKVRGPEPGWEPPLPESAR